MLASIAEHSSAFAKAVEGRFDATVEHCPGWTVANLVDHVTEVHWFWTTIAEERPTEPPGADDARRPSRLTDPAAAVAQFESAAARLVEVLGAADQDAACWTWAPAQQNVAFVTRHQVQEISVHHWDAVNAVGGSLVIEPDIADDAVTEFLTFSVSSDSDTGPAERGSLGGRFQLRATDTGTIWQVHSGQMPATVAFGIGDHNTGDDSGDAEIAATASDLLLWLYGRVDPDTSGVGGELLAQFRRLCYTD